MRASYWRRISSSCWRSSCSESVEVPDAWAKTGAPPKLVLRSAAKASARCKAVRGESAVPVDLLRLDSAVTDSNAAFFDVANNFHGVIAGCHEVLRRQGLLQGRWCLDPHEDLSPGQADAIDRVYRLYPELNDDTFVAANRNRWLA